MGSDMANFFDQFDEQPAPQAQGAAMALPSQGGNFFDQFDALGDWQPPKPPPGAITHNSDGTSTVYREDGTTETAKRDHDGLLGSDEANRRHLIQMEALAERGDHGALKSTVRRRAAPALQGVSFGFGDEVTAGVKAVVDWASGGPRSFGDNYDVTKEVMRQDLDAERKENPWYAYPAEIAGGILSGGAAVKAGATAAGRLPLAVEAGSPWAARVAAGAIDGAGMGALYGAGQGDGLKDSLSKAATGGVVGGALGGAISGAVPAIVGAAKSGAGKVAEFLGRRSAAPVVESAERLGVQLPAAVASENMATQRVASTLRNVPGGGDPLVKSSERAIRQLGEAADNTVAGFGGSNPYTAGGAAREAIEVGWAGRTKEIGNKLYGNVDHLVDKTVQTPLEATRKAATEILGEQAASRISGPGKAVSFVREAIDDPKGLTYEGVKNLRTRVGEMLKNKNALASSGVSERELQRIYAGLSDDLSSSVRNAGGDKAVSAFERANAFNRNVAGRKESLRKLIGAENDEAVYNRIVSAASDKGSANFDLLRQARNAVGKDAWDEVAGTVVSRMGRDAEGAFSPSRFLTDYGKLSPAGKGMLFNSTGRGELARSLDDLAAVSSKFKDLQKFANPSGTAQGGIGAALGAGLYAEPVTAISALLGARGMSMVLSKPAAVRATTKFLESIANASRVPGTYQRFAQNYLKRQSELYASRLGEALGIKIDPARLLAGLGRPAHADSQPQRSSQ